MREKVENRNMRFIAVKYAFSYSSLQRVSINNSTTSIILELSTGKGRKSIITMDREKLICDAVLIFKGMEHL